MITMQAMGKVARQFTHCIFSFGLIFNITQSVQAQDLVPVPFSALQGWHKDNHTASFNRFLETCSIYTKRRHTSQIAAVNNPAARIAACDAAQKQQTDIRRSPSKAQQFFERYFQPFQIREPQGAPFFTGYFEPEIQGAKKRTAYHSMPLLRLPANHSTQSIALRGNGDKLTASQKDKNGKIIPYPARREIENGALGSQGVPLVWLDPVDAFFTHIQGSARIRFNDGSSMRVAFAGRNGYPYTAIGQILIQRGILNKDEVTAARLKQWLRDNPAQAHEVMQQNASYIFFRHDNTLGAKDGPRGAAGIPLHEKRALAIDPQYWPYGTPIWVNVELPIPQHPSLQRLMIAQDTGAAIKGITRSDIFWGTGERAGLEAGEIKHSGQFIVLLPKAGKQMQ